MKKIKWVLAILAIVTLLKFASNKTRHIWTFNSSSIEESKEKESFVYQYEIIDVEYFNEAEAKNIVKDVVIWKEKQLTTEPFLIFFHPRRSNGKHSLILKSESFRQEPMVFARLKGNGYSGNQKGSHTVLTEDDFNEEEEIILYTDNKNTLASLKIRARN